MWQFLTERYVSFSTKACDNGFEGDMLMSIIPRILTKAESLPTVACTAWVRG